MSNLNEMHNKVQTREDFLRFMEALLKDLKENPSEWENVTLPDYLEATQRWTEDMDGYYLNSNLPAPQNVNWKVLADILIAAKTYE